MTFIVPPMFDKHLNRTKRAISALIQRQVITAFDMKRLNTWLKNFKSEEDLYLASHLLDFLVIRSSKMIESMCRNSVEKTIMQLLRRDNYWVAGEYDSMLARVKKGDKSLPFRFVAVEDFGVRPAKSGAELFRIYHRAKAIHKDLGIQPKKICDQRDEIKLLIFLDDFCGTGKQFTSEFCEEYKLKDYKSRFSLAYVPLIAHHNSHILVNDKAGYINFSPVETLSEAHDFFCKLTPGSDLWARDKANTVDDVKAHYNNLLKANGVSVKNDYNLNLAIGFDISTPNNTLKAYWSDQGAWEYLLKR